MTTLRAPLLCGSAVLLFGAASAGTTQTIGAGSAVTTVDRFASFDSIDHNGVSLSDYVEHQIFIGVSGDSFVGDGTKDFDPFHGANGADRKLYFPDGGSTEWVVVKTTDGKKIRGFEFMYGNGWTTGDIYGQYPWGNNAATLEWQTYVGTTKVSSGVVGVSPILEMGTIVGFSDPAGFDRLLLRSKIATSFDPNLQALALDNVKVQLATSSPWSDLGHGLAGTSGIPSLVGAGTLSPNSAGSLTLTSAKPSAMAVLFVSLSSSPVQLLGGTLVAFPVALSVNLSTSSGGSIALPFTWPSGVPTGTSMYFQYVVEDSGGPHGVSMSNARKAITP